MAAYKGDFSEGAGFQFGSSRAEHAQPAAGVGKKTSVTGGFEERGHGAGKKILVTGGAGYIGSHLCADLLEEGYDVVVLDNFWNSSPKSIKRVV